MRDSIHKYFQVGTIRWMSFPNRSVVDQPVLGSADGCGGQAEEAA